MSTRSRIGRIEQHARLGRVGCCACGRPADPGQVAWSGALFYLRLLPDVSCTWEPCAPQECSECGGALDPGGLPIQRQVIVLESTDMARVPDWPEEVKVIERQVATAERRQEARKESLQAMPEHGSGASAADNGSGSNDTERSRPPWSAARPIRRAQGE